MKSDPRTSDASGPVPGLYVHVPFCRTKCPYCDFYSVTSDALVDEWLASLAAEAALRRGAFGPFDTLYVGGGTPSVLGEREMSRLFEIVAAGFELAPGAEITIEANPDDVTASALSRWRALGATRVSLGVQSLNDADLRFMRRRHDASRARAAIDLVRAAGFAQLGVDLIYGFDAQSVADWENTLRQALRYSPEHLSCYQMTIEPSTPFGNMLEAGTLRLPGEERQRELFMATSDTLRAHGYAHYEISNFARGEEFVSRHNSKYWRHVPYLGLGPSAHSFRDGKRWWNVRSVEEYCRRAARGEDPVEDSETLGDDEFAFETLYLGLRTREGVPLDALRRYPGWETTLDTLRAESLLRVEGDRAVPTLNGFCLADALAIAFSG